MGFFPPSHSEVVAGRSPKPTLGEDELLKDLGEDLLALSSGGKKPESKLKILRLLCEVDGASAVAKNLPPREMSSQNVSNHINDSLRPHGFVWKSIMGDRANPAGIAVVAERMRAYGALLVKASEEANRTSSGGRTITHKPPPRSSPTDPASSSPARPATSATEVPKPKLTTPPANFLDATTAVGPNVLVISGLVLGRVFHLTLGKDTTIGRVKGGLGIDLSWDESVSGRHAELRAAGASWKVADISSLHGTYLNGSKLGRENSEPLRHGDIIQIGQTLLLFRDLSQLKASVERR